MIKSIKTRNVEQALEPTTPSVTFLIDKRGRISGCVDIQINVFIRK